MTRSALVAALEALDELGPAVLAERLRRGISRARAAREIGISYSTLEELESGVVRSSRPGRGCQGPTLSVVRRVLVWVILDETLATPLEEVAA